MLLLAWYYSECELLKYLHSHGLQMQNIIDFRGLEALKTNSEMATEISRLVLANAEKSQKDSRTITTITIFTMIYLPASFVSVSSEAPYN